MYLFTLSHCELYITSVFWNKVLVHVCIYYFITKLSILLTSTLGTIKNLIINCSNKAFENSEINYFWSVKNSLEVLDKLHAYIGDFESVQSFDFSTLYTTLPHILIKKNSHT